MNSAVEMLKPSANEDFTTIASAIDTQAKVSPDRPFLINPENGQINTYADTRKKIRCVAALLASKGIKPGESVSYACANSPYSALVMLAIMYGGYRATAINLVAGNETICYVLEHSQTRLVFVDAQTKPMLENLFEGLQSPPELVMMDENIFEYSADDFEGVYPASDSDGLLMYTSGTTGRPKGVLLTHQSLLSGGYNAEFAHKLSQQDRALCILPLYHINGLCVTIMGPLVSGGSVVLPPKFSVSTFWKIIADNQCSWFSVVPTQISYLLHNAEHSRQDHANCKALRFGRSASAPLSPDIHEAFEKEFMIPVIETMGLTETAAQILSNPLPPATRKIGSPGIAYGNEIMIADDTQIEMKREAEGEVLVRGPNVMRGYLKNEEATAQAITSAGWLRTGDLGRMDADGYVYITGRLKELIIKGGENIAPREIDDALYSHPDVIEAAAFACDCKNYGQRVEAGVVLSEGSTMTVNSLVKLCREKVGNFKAPDTVHILDELPKGPSGKIQRIKLAKMLQK